MNVDEPSSGIPDAPERLAATGAPVAELRPLAEPRPADEPRPVAEPRPED